MATIEEVLVPIYLLHRYQIQAVAKLIGGQYFSYTMRGDGEPAPTMVDAGKQQAAIDALTGTLDPAILMLPQSLVDIIPPRPPGHSLGRESFGRTTGVIFDPLSPANSAISLTLDVMLNQQRAARMNVFHAADSTLPGFEAVLDALIQAGWYGKRQTAIPGAIQRITGNQVLSRLMGVAADSTTTSQLRAQSLMAIKNLDRWLAKQKPSRLDQDWAAHYSQARHLIAAMMDDPAKMVPAQNTSAPPGSPIGN